MTNLREKIDRLKILSENYKMATSVKAELYKRIYDIKLALCEEASIDGIESIDLDSDIIEFTPRIDFEVYGGKSKEAQNKTLVVKQLVDLGLIEAKKVEYFEGVSINEKTFTTALKKLTIDQVIDLHSQKLLKKTMTPDIRIVSKEVNNG